MMFGSSELANGAYTVDDFFLINLYQSFMVILECYGPGVITNSNGIDNTSAIDLDITPLFILKKNGVNISLIEVLDHNTRENFLLKPGDSIKLEPNSSFYNFSSGPIMFPSFTVVTSKDNSKSGSVRIQLSYDDIVLFNSITEHILDYGSVEESAFK